MKLLKKLLSVSLLTLGLANSLSSEVTTVYSKQDIQTYTCNQDGNRSENEVKVIKPRFFSPKNIKTV